MEGFKGITMEGNTIKGLPQATPEMLDRILARIHAQPTYTFLPVRGIVYPDDPDAASKPILLPDPAEYPWYEHLHLPWSKNPSHTGNRRRLAETFQPLAALPAVFDPFSAALKHPPPTFFLGWPIYPRLTRAYALAHDLAWIVDPSGSDPVLKPSADVTDADELYEPRVLARMVRRFQPALELQGAYGPARAVESDEEDPCALIWSLCNNWDSPDERPSEKRIKELQEELGYEDGPQWYAATDAGASF